MSFFVSYLCFSTCIMYTLLYMFFWFSRLIDSTHLVIYILIRNLKLLLCFLNIMLRIFLFFHKESCILYTFKFCAIVNFPYSAWRISLPYTYSDWFHSSCNIYILIRNVKLLLCFLNIMLRLSLF
ncbi:hypothetical protein E1A91_D12G314600v1 [Gossypium mustelinum]|uniref:Uncharacterized protein n=1 Tax=Gossypium mustelinum TaxID=34275 RepID=A0A5D2SKG5_GOSMU|nr:hypothetical protein E1A91_D12G314600v1 [Gossypium mustelinum]